MAFDEGSHQPQMMILHLRRALILASLGCLAAASHLSAQIEVIAQMSKRDYVANEPVAVTITITNRAGRDIFLHGDSRHGWLDFMLKDQRGAPLTSLKRNTGFKAVNVPAGRSVSRTVNLGEAYRVSTPGRYGGYATVRIPGNEAKIYTSNRIHFNVTKARVLYAQKIGVPGSNSTREYRAMTFSNSGKSHLYVEVEDGKTGRVLRTFTLGEVIMFRKPTYTVDGNNNMHVLFLNTPEVWAHAQINPDGRLVKRDLYRRGAVGDPRLVTFANGEVKTGGGVAYNPEQERAQQARVRRLSERPRITYR